MSENEAKMNEGIPLQFRGGPREENDQYTGYPRELTIDTDFKTIHVHDGTTPGGFPLLRADLENLGSRFTGDKISLEVDGELVTIQDAVNGLIEKIDGLDFTMPTATHEKEGIVKLVTSVNSSSIKDAATPASVKSAYDLATQANNAAANAAIAASAAAASANSVLGIVNEVKNAPATLPTPGGVGSIALAGNLGSQRLNSGLSSMEVPFGRYVSGDLLRTTDTKDYQYGSSILAGTWVCCGTTSITVSVSGHIKIGTTVWQRIA